MPADGEWFFREAPTIRDVLNEISCLGEDEVTKTSFFFSDKKMTSSVLHLREKSRLERSSESNFPREKKHSKIKENHALTFV